MKRCNIDTFEIVIDNTEPPVLQENSVLVKLSYHAMLGSDSGHYAGLYGGCGIVQKVGSQCRHVVKGDRVVIWEPKFSEIMNIAQNSFVKIPGQMNMKDATLSFLGNYALKCVRKCEIQLGEHIGIFGVNIFGVLTAQFVKLSGGVPVLIDHRPENLSLSKNVIKLPTIDPNDKNFVTKVSQLTKGIGFDSIIILGLNKEKDLVEKSFSVIRPHGKIIFLGNRAQKFSPNAALKKEVNLNFVFLPQQEDFMNSNSGNGTFPHGYIRWSRYRNIIEFINLLHKGSLKIHSPFYNELSLEDAARISEMTFSTTSEDVFLVKWP